MGGAPSKAAHAAHLDLFLPRHTTTPCLQRIANACILCFDHNSAAAHTNDTKVGFHDQSNALIPKQLSDQFGVTAAAPVVCGAPSAGRAGVTDALETAFALTRTTRGTWVVSGEGNIVTPGVLVATGAGMLQVVERDGRILRANVAEGARVKCEGEVRG